MKLFNKILIGIITVISLTSLISINDVNSISWFKTKQVETAGMITMGSSNIISGDSIIFYKGRPAILQDLYIRSRGGNTAYTTTGSADTLKIYGTINGVPVVIGYIADATFTYTSPFVSYTPTISGIFDGTLYYGIIPENKFTNGDWNLDLMFKITQFK